MNDMIITMIICAVGVLAQCGIVYFGVRKSKKNREDALKALHEAKKKRQASVTILEFAELWRRQMSEDERMNLIIDWQDRLRKAQVILDPRPEDGEQ